MEKARISAYQLFVLILLFEIGSAVLVPIAIEAKRDAWLAILLGMVGGFGLFLVHFQLYRYYPDLMPTEYMQKLLGKFFGKILAFSYILFFLYLSARVLRDFGEMLVTFSYSNTPLLVVHTLLMLVIMYAVKKGIEVIARTGEIFFILMYFLAVLGFTLIIVSGLVELKQLQPMLEGGLGSVMKVVATQSVYIPFGEVVIFSMIFPYLLNPKKGKLAGLIGIALSGINLAIVMAINISVLGFDLTARSQFPLLTTIQGIQFANFIERLDVFFMVSVVIGIFFKVTLFFYGAVESTAILFNIKRSVDLVYPLGIVVIFLSITIASNYTEHIKEGLVLTTHLLHPLFLAIIPIGLLGIAYLKNRKKG